MGKRQIHQWTEEEAQLIEELKHAKVELAPGCSKWQTLATESTG